MSLPVAGGLELDDIQGSFHPKPFWCSMIVGNYYVLKVGH